MTKTIDRTDRETETRESEDWNLDVWEEKEILGGKAVHNGKRRRWIAVSSRNQKDAANWSRKREEGWRKVDPSEDPDFRFDVEDGMGEIVRGGGLVLCEMPERKAQARERYYAEMRAEKINTVHERLTSGVNDRYVPFMDPERPASEETVVDVRSK